MPVPLKHVDPNRPPSMFRRAYAALANTRLGRFMSVHLVWKVDPYLMRLTGGRLGMGLVMPTALLETRGAKSGAVRRNVVIYFHDSDRVTIVASKLGYATHPAWFHNLQPIPTSRSVASPCGRRWLVRRLSARDSGRSLTVSSRPTRHTVEKRRR